MSLLVGKDAIKLKEMASRLSVSTKTLYRHIKNGKLKAFKIGNDWYVSANDYDSYIVSAQIATKLEWFKPNHLNKLVSIMNSSVNSLEDGEKFIRGLLDEVKIE